MFWKIKIKIKSKSKNQIWMDSNAVFKNVCSFMHTYGIDLLLISSYQRIKLYTYLLCTYINIYIMNLTPYLLQLRVMYFILHDCDFNLALWLLWSKICNSEWKLSTVRAEFIHCTQWSQKLSKRAKSCLK